ncbi:MAG TPA: hypothetical protein PLI62_14380 [Spirochaetota bacterium]|nr:hypothetical protein [Spirochaetota bacterium]
MTDYIIVLSVAIMVFSIASLFIFARGKFVEGDDKTKEKKAAQKTVTAKSTPDPADQPDNTNTSADGESAGDTPRDT